MVLIIRISISL